MGYFRRKAIQIMHEIFHVNELLSQIFWVWLFASFESMCLMQEMSMRIGQKSHTHTHTRTRASIRFGSIFIISQFDQCFAYNANLIIMFKYCEYISFIQPVLLAIKYYLTQWQNLHCAVCVCVNALFCFGFRWQWKQIDHQYGSYVDTDNVYLIYATMLSFITKTEKKHAYTQKCQDYITVLSSIISSKQCEQTKQIFCCQKDID